MGLIPNGGERSEDGREHVCQRRGKRIFHRVGSRRHQTPRAHVPGRQEERSLHRLLDEWHCVTFGNYVNDRRRPVDLFFLTGAKSSEQTYARPTDGPEIACMRGGRSTRELTNGAQDWTLDLLQGRWQRDHVEDPRSALVGAVLIRHGILGQGGNRHFEGVKRPIPNNGCPRQTSSC